MSGRGHLDRLRRRLAAGQDGICPECGLPLPEDLAGTAVDHIIPKARGGPDAPWNRQLVHSACNRAKWFKLTDRAAALAAEHGVVLHMPIPASAHANRPFTRDDSLRRDYLNAMFSPPSDERDRLMRQYRDELLRQPEATS